MSARTFNNAEWYEIGAVAQECGERLIEAHKRYVQPFTPGDLDGLSREARRLLIVADETLATLADLADEHDAEA